MFKFSPGIVYGVFLSVWVLFGYRIVIRGVWVRSASSRVDQHARFFFCAAQLGAKRAGGRINPLPALCAEEGREIGSAGEGYC